MRLMVDGLAAALGVAALSAAIVFETVLDSVGGKPIAVATGLAYPLLDLILLGLTVGALATTGWRFDRTWMLLALGVSTFWLADSLYLVRTAEGVYESGGWFDAGWWAGLALIAAAAWQPVPTRERRPSEERVRVIAVPLAFGAVGLGLLVYGAIAQVNLLAIGLAAASVIAVMARATLTFGENVAMLRTSRDEALTDALTGLGNRRSLARALDDLLPQATPERPLVLALFDLDGFKQYNDTFGHPAGDTLLVRLGGNLSAFLHGRGQAFRMGGDEFCALFQIGGESHGPMVHGAAAALSEHGDGFSIGCSFGAIALPIEASDPVEALRIADQRMYANKHAGRMSAGRQSKDVLLRALAERDPGLGTHSDVVAMAAAHRRGARPGSRRGRERPPRQRAARRRQGRDPRRHPRQARPADRRGVVVRPPPLRDRRADHPRGARARAAWRRSSAPATSAGTAPATRTPSRATRSRSARASSRSPTRSRRCSPAARTAPLRARPRRRSTSSAAAPAPSSTRRGRRLVRRLHARGALRPRVSAARGQSRAARVRPRMAAGAQTLKRTPLYDRHVAAGARLVPFAGWEMPVQYAGIREEHIAVRTRAGVFDVSHMGEVETAGPDAERFLQRILSNDVSKIGPDGAQYSVMCRENGGVLDDLFTYRHGSGFLTVTNAVQPRARPGWMRHQARGYDVKVHDRLKDYVMLAVQGPQARGIVARLADAELPARFRTARMAIAGAPGVLVCGTGYTGEDGVELLIAPGHAPAIWDALLAGRRRRRRASARATRCAWRSASTCTATT